MTSAALVPVPVLARLSRRHVDRAKELGALLRKWRKDRGLQRTEAIDELVKLNIDLSYGYLAKLESGARSLAAASIEYREGLRTIYRVPAHVWVEKTGLYVPSSPSLPDGGVRVESEDLRSGTRTVPVHDLLSAGPGGDGGIVIDYIDIPESWKGRYAAYEVSGDSMAPHIPNGARVVIRVQDYASPGNEIVAFVPEYGMVVKVLERITENQEYVLTSYNPDYRPIWTQEITIYGVVSEVRLSRKIVNGNHSVN